MTSQWSDPDTSNNLDPVPVKIIWIRTRKPDIILGRLTVPPEEPESSGIGGHIAPYVTTALVYTEATDLSIPGNGIPIPYSVCTVEAVDFHKLRICILRQLHLNSWSSDTSVFLYSRVISPEYQFYGLNKL